MKLCCFSSFAFLPLIQLLVANKVQTEEMTQMTGVSRVWFWCKGPTPQVQTAMEWQDGATNAVQMNCTQEATFDQLCSQVSSYQFSFKFFDKRLLSPPDQIAQRLASKKSQKLMILCTQSHAAVTDAQLSGISAGAVNVVSECDWEDEGTFESWMRPGGWFRFQKIRLAILEGEGVPKEAIKACPVPAQPASAGSSPTAGGSTLPVSLSQKKEDSARVMPTPNTDTWYTIGSEEPDYHTNIISPNWGEGEDGGQQLFHNSHNAVIRQKPSF